VEVVGDILVDDGVAGIYIQSKEAGWSVLVRRSRWPVKLRDKGIALHKGVERTVATSCTTTQGRLLRQHVCDLSLSCSVSAVISAFRGLFPYLHLPIDYLERWKP
jgi:hypothetical protein